MIRRRLEFRGTVQGVGFRAATRAIALSLNLSGWVRNEPDGSVLAEAQGPPADLDRLVAELREQMPGLLRSVHALDMPTDPDEHAFVIRR